jgi:hypothetical protein
MFSVKISENWIGRKSNMRLFAVLLMAAASLIMGATVSQAWAGGSEFEATEFKIEFNYTDQDVGVQAFIDGEPWRSVTIINPKWRTILAVKSIRSLAKQGVTELFLESGEPMLDEVSLQEFLHRFPQGPYRFFGTDVDGKFVRGKAEFTHVIPCGPSGLAAEGENTSDDPIVLSWLPVTEVVNLDSAFGNVTCEESEDLEIVAYRVETEWVEVLNEDTEDEEEIVHRFGIDLKPDQFSVTVPPEFIPAGQEYKFEVLAIEESGNQTLTELADLEAPEPE